MGANLHELPLIGQTVSHYSALWIPAPCSNLPFLDPARKRNSDSGTTERDKESRSSALMLNEGK
jgi:hypothetical protein